MDYGSLILCLLSFSSTFDGFICFPNNDNNNKPQFLFFIFFWNYFVFFICMVKHKFLYRIEK